MSEFFDNLNEDHMAMIAAQPVFFVATAAAEGRINLSPKGYDAVRVLGRAAWRGWIWADRGTRPMPISRQMAGSR
jgi:hypothetical protein